MSRSGECSTMWTTRRMVVSVRPLVPREVMSRNSIAMLCVRRYSCKSLGTSSSTAPAALRCAASALGHSFSAAAAYIDRTACAAPASRRPLAYECPNRSCLRSSSLRRLASASFCASAPLRLCASALAREMSASSFISAANRRKRAARFFATSESELRYSAFCSASAWAASVSSYSASTSLYVRSDPTAMTALAAMVAQHSTTWKYSRWRHKMDDVQTGKLGGTSAQAFYWGVAVGGSRHSVYKGWFVDGESRSALPAPDGLRVAIVPGACSRHRGPTRGDLWSDVVELAAVLGLVVGFGLDDHAWVLGLRRRRDSKIISWGRAQQIGVKPLLLEGVAPLDECDLEDLALRLGARHCYDSYACTLAGKQIGNKGLLIVGVALLDGAGL